MASDALKNNLADKLRREDPEQFHTLVRMHLSFVLDLNTNDYECSEKNKFRPSKWVFGKKAKCLIKGVMEGAPLTQEGICQVYQLIEYLSKESNICQEGLFRRTGKLTRQQDLKALLNKGGSLDLNSGNFSVHDCASVLKSFLAELPEPLLTDAHYPIYCQIAEFCGPACSSEQIGNNEFRLLQSLQLLLLLLPAENRILLRDVLRLLNLTASFENCNKMSAESLSTLFTPHLLCPRKLTPEAFHANSQAMSGIVAFMIHKGDQLFEIPPKLATDIRVYWVERGRRNVPGKMLDESVCDGAAANTVFTFVDRERSAQENSSNPTEVALAQLYAHIQSLPESSKKRKLIKQFNKENGQGTPLQASFSQKHHLRSKSLGDSIKRHIFNKGVKRHKTSNNPSGFAPLRSLSQEVLNSPLTSASKVKLFHCSLEEDTDVNETLEPVTKLPVLQKSLCDSNSAIVRMRHSTKLPKSSFTSRLMFSESNDREQEQDESNSSIRKAILHNLAHQVTQKLSPSTGQSAFWNPLGTNAQGMEDMRPFSSTSAVHKAGSPNCGDSMVISEAYKVNGEDANDTPETMMTPRSRKPVVVLSGSNICHLSNVAKWRKHSSNMCENRRDKDLMDRVSRNPDENNSQSNNILLTENVSSGEPSQSQSNYSDTMCSEHVNCRSGDSLTSTFKSYLMSRSVLTASPVDLSFSSRTGDFDTSSEERCLSIDSLGDSLLYCLDGNDPRCKTNVSDSHNDNCENSHMFASENVCEDCNSIHGRYSTEEVIAREECIATDTLPCDVLKTELQFSTPIHETTL